MHTPFDDLRLSTFYSFRDVKLIYDINDNGVQLYNSTAAPV